MQSTPHSPPARTLRSLAPQPFKQDTMTCTRRALGQFGGGVAMSLILLLPLWIYGPFAIIYEDFFGDIPINLCGNDLHDNDFIQPDLLIKGSFTIAQVRLITLAWNAVVGRGLQALMAWGSYRIILHGLTRIAEATAVDYNLFTVFLLPTSSFQYAIALFRGLLQLRGWRPKFTMAFLAYSLLLLLAIPSLFEASAGYVRPYGLTDYSGSERKGTYYAPTEQLPSLFHSHLKSNTAVYTCHPDTYYKWGFVMNLYFLLFGLFAVWVFGMFVIWMDAQHNSHLTRVGRHFTGLRAILDLADAVRRELGPDTNGYTDVEIRKVLSNRMPVRYYILLDDSGQPSVSLIPGPTVNINTPKA